MLGVVCRLGNDGAAMVFVAAEIPAAAQRDVRIGARRLAATGVPYNHRSLAFD